jgi:hypothetical protein
MVVFGLTVVWAKGKILIAVILVRIRYIVSVRITTK